MIRHWTEMLLQGQRIFKFTDDNQHKTQMTLTLITHCDV